MKVRRIIVAMFRWSGVLLTCLTVGSVQRAEHFSGAVPNLSMWVDTWFKVKMTSTVYHFSNIGVKPTPGYTISESDEYFLY